MALDAYWKPILQRLEGADAEVPAPDGKHEGPFILEDTDWICASPRTILGLFECTSRMRGKLIFVAMGLFLTGCGGSGSSISEGIGVPQDNQSIPPSKHSINWSMHGTGAFVPRDSNASLATNGSIAILACGASGDVLITGDGHSWDKVSSGIGSLYGALGGNGIFIATSGEDNHTIEVSVDGRNWQSQNLGFERTGGFFFAGSRFLLQGNDGLLHLSVDGKTWNTSNCPIRSINSAVQFNGKTFVASTEFNDQLGFIAYTTDFITWNLVDASSTPVTCLAQGDGLLVGANRSGTIYTSTDGIAWVQRFQTPYGYDEIVCAGGKFIASSDLAIATSNDGLNWEAATIPSSNFRQVIPYGNSFLALTTGNLLNSEDGRSWNFSLSDFAAMTSGSSGLVAVGNDHAAYTSKDGAQWSATSTPSALNRLDVTYGLGHYVTVGDSLTIETSSDGASWSTIQQSNLVDGPLRCVAYGNGRFVASGGLSAGGRMFTSTDGANWSDITVASGITEPLVRVRFVNDRFLGVDGTRVGWVSEDGLSWRHFSFDNGFYSISDLAFGGGDFVACGALETILSSTDTSNWSVRRQLPGGQHTRIFEGVVFGNQSFVALGTESLGAYSTDGQTWVDTALPVSADYSTLIFAQGRFIGSASSQCVITAP